MEGYYRLYRHWRRLCHNTGISLTFLSRSYVYFKKYVFYILTDVAKYYSCNPIFSMKCAFTVVASKPGGIFPRKHGIDSAIPFEHICGSDVEGRFPPCSFHSSHPDNFLHWRAQSNWRRLTFIYYFSYKVLIYPWYQLWEARRGQIAKSIVNQSTQEVDRYTRYPSAEVTYYGGKPSY